MTGGRYGHLNRKLASSETFACPACTATGTPWSMDRDVHAARNILLWFLVGRPQTRSQKKLWRFRYSSTWPLPLNVRGGMATEN